MPNTSVKDLIAALQINLDHEITEEALGDFTVTQLKRSSGKIYEVDSEWEGEDADNSDIADFKEAVRILWGEKGQCEQELPSKPYQEGDRVIDYPETLVPSIKKRLELSSNILEMEKNFLAIAESGDLAINLVSSINSCSIDSILIGLIR